MHYNTHSLALTILGSYLPAFAAFLLLCPAVASHASEGGPTIPVELEIELDSQDYLVGEDFTFTIRIVNPNPYPIELRRFGFNHNAPRMEMSPPGSDEYFRFAPGDSEVLRNSNMTIAPNSSADYHRFFCVTLGDERWHLPAGLYRLHATADLRVAVPNQAQESVSVNLTSDDALFTLHSPTGVDRKAFEFLRSRWYERKELVRSGPPDWTQYYLRLYEEFLVRFADSAYTPKIRLKLANLLTRELLDRRSPLYEDDDLARLYDECLTFCLDRGGAYTEELLRLGSYSPAESAMRITTRYKKIGLLKRIVKELEKKYPDDKEGILYRRLFVANATGSTETATKLARAMLKQFPNGKHARYAEHVLKQDPQTKESIDAGGQ